jgi:hypothetical protein
MVGSCPPGCEPFLYVISLLMAMFCLFTIIFMMTGVMRLWR